MPGDGSLAEDLARLDVNLRIMARDTCMPLAFLVAAKVRVDSVG